MSVIQECRVIQLVTPVECGLPKCTSQTTDAFIEDWAKGFYNVLEIVPFCPDHHQELLLRWQSRYAAIEEDDEVEAPEQDEE